MIERCASHLPNRYKDNIEIEDEVPEEEFPEERIPHPDYGLLYNLYAVNLNNNNGIPLTGISEQRLIPSGWRLPTLNDWNDLRGSLTWGDRGAKLKSTRRGCADVGYPQPNDPLDLYDTTDVNDLWSPVEGSGVGVNSQPTWMCKTKWRFWIFDNWYEGEDEVGFRALPSGMRIFGIGFKPMGGHCEIWMNEPHTSISLQTPVLLHSTDKIKYNYCDYRNGVPVRLCRNASGNDTGTITDADNNTYNYIKIGSRQWLTTNWRSKKYVNGDPIYSANARTLWDDYNTLKERTVVVNGISRVVTNRIGCYAYPLWLNFNTTLKNYPI